MINIFSNPSYFLPPLIGVIATLALLVTALLLSQRDLSTKLFCGALGSMILMNLIIFGMRSSSDADHALLWQRAVGAPVLAMFVFYYHFTLVYTNNRGQRNILRAYYLLLALVAFLSPTDLLVKGMRVETYGYTPVVGLGSYILLAGGPFLLLAAVYNLLKRYRASTSHEERWRLTYLVAAVIFPLTGAILDGFTSLPPATIWGNLIFSIICTIAILKYHLFDIRIFMRKSLVYLLISVVIAVPYAAVLVLVNQFLKSTTELWWLHAILILLLAIVLRPLYDWAQNLVNRIFYRERYDFLKELEDFSQETHDVSNPDQLISSLVELIGRALQSSSVQLLLPFPSGDFITASSDGEHTSRLTIRSDNPLLQRLRSNEDILRRQGLDTVPQLQALSTKVRNELEKMRAKLFVPLKTKEKDLIGILILGEKLSEQPYSRDDEVLILTVASKVAVELENARLYSQEKIMRRELERQNEQKTEFLHSVAHELKTPLTAIISSSELLATELSSTTPSQREKLIGNIRHSAWSMDKKVTTLLNLAKMQVGDLEIKSESLEIGVIIEEVRSQLLPIFKNKEQSLELEIPGSLSPMKGDREKLEQILLNLLSNANKFSPIGGNITLRAREVDDRIVVEVKDSAEAITEEEKEKIFNPYYRGADTGERRNIPGLGLGLAVSKKLVELHEGRIWVESEPGKGNVFAFSLPTRNSDKGN